MRGTEVNDLLQLLQYLSPADSHGCCGQTLSGTVPDQRTAQKQGSCLSNSSMTGDGIFTALTLGTLERTAC